MFLKKLTIEKNSKIIQDIAFQKGVNLIVDETKTKDKKESGNNVGKTTVLRLIDYCLGSDGKNIYQDTEFKSKSNSQIEKFLKENNVVITLVLKEDLEDEKSDEIEIRRNFLSYKEKIQEINGEKIGNKEFPKELKRLIFHSALRKPTFRQIISKNIRDEKSRLQNTLKVLHSTTTGEEYEALYLFWLGIDLNVSDKKQRLLAQKKVEEGLQKRLRKESSLPQITQSLLVVNRNIDELRKKKDSFNLNERYEEDIETLNTIKAEVNKTATHLSRLEMRRELIKESAGELDREISEVDTDRISKLYEEAKALIPNIQKTYEDTLLFHNQMIAEKKKYISSELPSLEAEVASCKSRINLLISEEKKLTESLRTSGAMEELQRIILDLNSAHEKKGNLEEQKRLWENTLEKTDSIKKDLDEIEKGISSLDDTIQERVSGFNKYFSEISNRLYGEQFILSPEKGEKGYELNISSISGNLGTGKKKGQMAAFDLAYIQFADAYGIDCLHFILHDQIENIHDNQISNLLTEIAAEINCQYILPVLRDKLPSNIDVSQYEILSLSQSDKLFKLK